MTDDITPVTPLNPWFVPRYYMLASGAGEDSEPLVAFDKALLAAKIANVNLIKLSSVLAPGTQRLKSLSMKPGAFVGAAYAHFFSNTKGQLISAAVAIAYPTVTSEPGIIMEAAGIGPAKSLEERVSNMAAAALHSRRQTVLKIETISIQHEADSGAAVVAAVVEI